MLYISKSRLSSASFERDETNWSKNCSIFHPIFSQEYRQNQIYENKVNSFNALHINIKTVFRPHQYVVYMKS